MCCANSQVLLRGLHSTNSFKVSWSRFDERSDLGSSLNDVPPEENRKPVLNLAVITPWP